MSNHPTATVPDQRGRFGDFGGRFVPETLTRALDQLCDEYDRAKKDPQFQHELAELLRTFVGRPNPLYHAKRLSEAMRRGADLAQTGRSQPYRRPQDQQHAGPGAADVADGQDGASSRKRARGSTASPRRRPAPISACLASSTWARKIFAGNRRMSLP